MAFEDPLRKSAKGAAKAQSVIPISQPVAPKKQQQQKKPSLFDDDEDLAKPATLETTTVIVQDRVERAYVEEKKQTDPNSLFKIDRAKASALFGDFGDDEEDTSRGDIFGSKSSTTPAGKQSTQVVIPVAVPVKKPSLFDDEDDAPLSNPTLTTMGDAQGAGQSSQPQTKPASVVPAASVAPQKKEKKKQNLLFGDDSDEDAVENAIDSAPAQPRRKQISIFDNEDEEEVARENRTLQGVFIPTGALPDQPDSTQPTFLQEDDSLREIEEKAPAIDMKEIERLASLELEKEEREKYRKEHKTTVKTETKPAPTNVVVDDDDDLFSMVSAKPKSGASGIDSFNFSAYIQQNSSVSSKGLFD